MSYLDTVNRKLYNTNPVYKEKIDKDINDEWIYLDIPENNFLVNFHVFDGNKVQVFISVSGEACINIKKYTINKKAGIHVISL